MSRPVFEALDSVTGRESLPRALPRWLQSQRWFGAKARDIGSAEIVDWFALSIEAALVFAQIQFADGTSDIYQLPLTISANGEIHDATSDEECRQVFLKLIEAESSIKSYQGGILSARQSTAFAAMEQAQQLPSRVGSAEQSNTSILFGKKLILKLFRRLQPGANPDVEVSRFLTDVAHFPRIPAFLGEITLQRPNAERTSLAILQQFVPNCGDAWQWTLSELARIGQPNAHSYGEAASLLGRRTAEMHLALATNTSDASFQSEPITDAHLAADVHRIRTRITEALDAVETSVSSLPPEATVILSKRQELLAQTDAILTERPSGLLIRIHGDYHLGQILRTTADDFVIVDFEGEPAGALAERRQKHCPLRDVAGMLRSFSYAAQTATRQDPAMVAQFQRWEQTTTSGFLAAYRDSISAQPGLSPQHTLAAALLRGYLLEKACYEMLYELNNRPQWLMIPISGILTLLAPNEPIQ